MTRTQKIGTTVVIGVAIVGAVVLAKDKLHHRYGRQATFIRLSLSNGICTATVDDTLGGNNNQPLKWTVVNNDCPAQYVVLRGGTVDTSVIQPYPVQSGSAIGPGQSVDLPMA